jgi:two-component system, OmpR family, alkaline phosphatase synthesis response regulator PhoP
VKVLIVDDDEMVRTVCTGMLKLLQHDVVAVNGGEAAIRTLQSSDTKFDLILLDELMPGMSGPQTMQQMAYLGIRVPIILCSGREMTVEEFIGSDKTRPDAMLTKPFTIQRLQEAVLKAMETT